MKKFLVLIIVIIVAVITLIICSKDKLITKNEVPSDWIYSENPPNGYDGALDTDWETIPIGGSFAYVVFSSDPHVMYVAWENKGVPAVPDRQGRKYYGPKGDKFPSFLRNSIQNEFIAGRMYVIISRVQNSIVPEKEAWKISR
jgi:hypothetical protein